MDIKVLLVQSGMNLAITVYGSENRVTAIRSVAVTRYGILEKLEISGVLAYSNLSSGSWEMVDVDRKGISATHLGFRM